MIRFIRLMWQDMEAVFMSALASLACFISAGVASIIEQRLSSDDFVVPFEHIIVVLAITAQIMMLIIGLFLICATFVLAFLSLLPKNGSAIGKEMDVRSK